MATTGQPSSDHSVTSILGLYEKRIESPVDLSNERPKKRQRRNRTYFEEEALHVLEASYKINYYPDVTERMKIAKEINEDETRVQIWFQNRRARERRKSGTRLSKTNRTKKVLPPVTIPTVTIQPEPVPEPVQLSSEPAQTVPTLSDIYRQFNVFPDTVSNQMYPSWYPYYSFRQFPYNQWTDYPQFYPPTPDNTYADNSVQHVPQIEVLDLSKKKQFSPTCRASVDSPDFIAFVDYPPKAVSPIPTTPQKGTSSSIASHRIYTSSPISGKYSTISIPSLYRSAFSPVTKPHDSDCRPADIRSFVSSSSGKEESLSSDILFGCDFLNSAHNNVSDCIVLDID